MGLHAGNNNNITFSPVHHPGWQGRRKMILLSYSHLGTLLTWTIIHRLLAITVLLIANKYVQPFDSSASLLLNLDSTYQSTGRITKHYSTSSLRWDIVHFLGVASPRPLPLSDLIDISLPVEKQIWSPVKGIGGGLHYEHSLAFQPGIFWLFRLLGFQINGHWYPTQSIYLTGSLAILLSISLPGLFYIVTILLTNNQKMARLSSFLSIFSFTPATLITPTAEPFFAFFCLIGHILLAYSNRDKSSGKTITFTFLASISFGLATTFRANGILLVGFIIWNLVWIQDNNLTLFNMIWRTLLSAIFSIVTIFPFILSQIWAFNRLCTNSTSSVEWCQGKFVIPYNYIQSHYWNVGPFRYWTISQLPNWILASPVLYLLGRWLIMYYAPDFKLVIRKTIRPFYLLTRNKEQFEPNSNHIKDQMTFNIQTAPNLLPFAHYTLILFLILTSSSHVQIALRFATQGALPAVWWSAADLIEKICSKNSKNFQRILTCMICWQITSIVLYAGFYPPA